MSNPTLMQELRNMLHSPVYICIVLGYAAYSFVTMVRARGRQARAAARPGEGWVGGRGRAGQGEGCEGDRARA